ncbi:hypothetical protein BS17DRAFT_315886 [Gyrodon lividus]|nr:hypothetical protein BS17DRAFT_315886 [Gyrodon lividus]
MKQEHQVHLSTSYSYWCSFPALKLYLLCFRYEFLILIFSFSHAGLDSTTELGDQFVYETRNTHKAKLPRLQRHHGKLFKVDERDAPVCQLDDFVSFYVLMLDRFRGTPFIWRVRYSFSFLIVVCVVDSQPLVFLFFRTCSLNGGNSRLIGWKPKYTAENLIAEAQIEGDASRQEACISYFGICCWEFLPCIRRIPMSIVPYTAGERFMMLVSVIS